MPCKDVAVALRPQPEGDFNSLKGKFKILMYEVGIAKALDTCARTPVPTGRFVREPGEVCPLLPFLSWVQAWRDDAEPGGSHCLRDFGNGRGGARCE